MNMIRWEPFRTFDRVLNDFPTAMKTESASYHMAADVYEEGSNLIVEVNMAGVNPENLDLTIENNVLRIVGSWEDEEENNRNYYAREIQRGRFERTIRLPHRVDEEAAEADFTHGILKVTLPRAEGKKLNIRINGS